MRVLHANDTKAQRGGVERYLDGLMPALGGAGIEAKWLARDESTPDEVRRAIADFAPHVIHVHHWSDLDTLDAFFAAAPVVRTFHDHCTTCPGGARYLPVLGRVCTKAYGATCLPSAYATGCNLQRPSAVLSSYTRVREELERYVKYARIITAGAMVRDVMVQHGASPDAFDVIPYFPQIEPALDVPAEPGLLLFAGRVVREKGLDTAIRALALLPHARLIVAGEGRALPSALRLAERLGVRARVECVGWADATALAQLYARATITLFPSRWPEPFGIVGIEAMATGRPVIAADVGGVRTWLAEGKTGLLHAPGDARGLAAAVGTLLADPERARRMGEAGRARALGEFGREAHVDALLRTYGQAAKLDASASGGEAS
ncbi:MAG: glycosyltransferase family 4 protein [Candidatus Thermoplasmatota archaeon]